MTLKEALIALAEGKKVKKKIWVSGYIHLADGVITSDTGKVYKLYDGNIYDGNTWELYEEPKKKVKVTEWLVESPRSAFPFIMRDLCTEAEAKQAHPWATKLTPLRSFEVEES